MNLSFCLWLAQLSVFYAETDRARLTQAICRLYIWTFADVSQIRLVMYFPTSLYLWTILGNIEHCSCHCFEQSLEFVSECAWRIFRSCSVVRFFVFENRILLFVGGWGATCRWTILNGGCCIVRRAWELRGSTIGVQHFSNLGKHENHSLSTCAQSVSDSTNEKTRRIYVRSFEKFCFFIMFKMTWQTPHKSDTRLSQIH